MKNYLILIFKFLLFVDFAALKVSDTQLDSWTADLYFQVIPETPLSVRASNKIYAELGSVTPIGRDVLDLWTDRPLEEVIITVLEGGCRKNGVHLFDCLHAKCSLKPLFTALSFKYVFISQSFYGLVCIYFALSKNRRSRT